MCASMEPGSVGETIPVETTPPPDDESRAILLEPGPWDPHTAGDVIAFIVVHGLLIRELGFLGHACGDLLTNGDVIAWRQMPESLIAADERLEVIEPARLLRVDEAMVHVRPALLVTLLQRAAEQERRQATHRAIAQLPRVEDRLLAVFWHLAERHGRVGPDGALLSLSLRHEFLGRLVGAARPTVSLALKALLGERLVTRSDEGDWLLDPRGLERFELSPARVSR
jgi:CRP-like cAMP-binding protein